MAAGMVCGASTSPGASIHWFGAEPEGRALQFRTDEPQQAWLSGITTAILS